MLVAITSKTTKSWSLSRRFIWSATPSAVWSRQKNPATTSAPPSTIFEGDQTYSKSAATISHSPTFDQVKPEDYDALVLPGGRAPEYIRLNPRVIEIVRPTSPRRINPSLPSPRRSKSLPCRCRSSKKCSALSWQSAPTSPRPEALRSISHMTEAIVDGNLVTAPAWPAHPPGSAKFLAVLGTRLNSNSQTNYLNHYPKKINCSFTLPKNPPKRIFPVRHPTKGRF